MIRAQKMQRSHTQPRAAGVDFDRYQQLELIAVWEEIEFVKVF